MFPRQMLRPYDGNLIIKLRCVKLIMHKPKIGRVEVESPDEMIPRQILRPYDGNLITKLSCVKLMMRKPKI
jgi:hypothetical protein